MISAFLIFITNHTVWKLVINRGSSGNFSRKCAIGFTVMLREWVTWAKMAAVWQLCNWAAASDESSSLLIQYIYGLPSQQLCWKHMHLAGEGGRTVRFEFLPKWEYPLRNCRGSFVEKNSNQSREKVANLHSFPAITGKWPWHDIHISTNNPPQPVQQLRRHKAL